MVHMLTENIKSTKHTQNNNTPRAAARKALDTSGASASRPMIHLETRMPASGFFLLSPPIPSVCRQLGFAAQTRDACRTKGRGRRRSDGGGMRTRARRCVPTGCLGRGGGGQAGAA